MENLHSHLQSLICNYPHPQMALIYFLKIIKDNKDCIEPDDVIALSKMCDVKTEDIIKLMDHYPYFSDSDDPAVHVCMGLSCYLKGAEEILNEMTSDQGKSNGKTSSVKTSHCLGFCYQAPVVQLSDGLKYSVQ